jgi:hypothetical protein
MQVLAQPFDSAPRLLALDLVGSIAVLSMLPGVAHSRLLMAAADSLMAIVSMWTTVAMLLMYLGIQTGERPKR